MKILRNCQSELVSTTQPTCAHFAVYHFVQPHLLNINDPIPPLLCQSLPPPQQILPSASSATSYFNIGARFARDQRPSSSDHTQHVRQKWVQSKCKGGHQAGASPPIVKPLPAPNTVLTPSRVQYLALNSLFNWSFISAPQLGLNDQSINSIIVAMR